MKKISFIAVSLLMFLCISCRKDTNLMEIDNPQHSVLSQESGESYITMGLYPYSVTPDYDFTSYSPSGFTLPGGMNGYGSALGGVIKAYVKQIGSNTFTVTVSKQDNSTFSTTGQILIHTGSVAGVPIATLTTSSGQTTYSLSFSLPNGLLDQGVQHFYPVYKSSNGIRYFAEPFMVYTSPSYDQGPYWDGKLLATIDEVLLRASGPSNLSSSSPYQCTDFCQRYYSYVYGLSFNISIWGNASNWINNQDSRFEKYEYPSNVVAPRVGDILCLDNVPHGLGHVAIIIEVSANEVKVAHQNSGPWAPIGFAFSRIGDVIQKPSNSWKVMGLLRKK